MHELARSGREQTRLTVSNSTDSHEQLARRVANDVEGGSSNAAHERWSPDGARRPAREPTEVPSSVTDEIRAPGRPLDGEVRQDMERRLGHDFSRVRIHDGGSAQRSAYDVGAHAYTVGRDIVFGAGQYAPGTDRGRRLIAHELAHTIDQAAVAGAPRWLDREPVKHPEDERTLKPPAPYVVAPKMDEVALRSSPSGRRVDNRFYNLVGSIRQDARLLVEDRKGHWMRVRVLSGTALDGRTNQPRPAAGLSGWVSEELLERTNQPIPVPIRPEDYHSLEQFSKAWPYQDPTGQAEKIWVSQSRQTWTNKALAAAGIKPEEWKPRTGFRRSKPVFEKVYAYYSSLYLADHRLKWAAMAKLAGGEVFRGFRDQIVPAEEFGEALARAGKRDDGEISIGELAGGAYQVYSGSMDIVLLQMQQAIFMDLAWQHQAYREGGIKALAAAAARGELDKDGLAAWQEIDSGDPSRVSKGNQALLKREQYQVLQGGGKGGYYKQIQDIPDNDMIPETMSEEAKSPIPGGKPFADVVPGGDITRFEDRWKWLEKDMIPAYEKLSPAELERLVRKSLGELADRKF
ncbi:DUF4157 domain-containing protein [Actinopolymorpha rutila]|uniref:eCIS core domain-containing protein n=1 Tax=Actinopolymorpha rutila TaxID=446787 RepID=A0A852ZIL2_9ACTN|nr:DUF4157 domain-containing protein [Actinopolymorpha rutila]NYH92794.1 hypothetical protein [Actinopolymorpha rutila]